MRIEWWRLGKEQFAYSVRSTESNSCEIALIVGGRTVETAIVTKSTTEVLSLAKRAREETSRRRNLKLSEASEMHRLVVTYGPDSTESFSVECALAEMLRTFDACPALEELLDLASRRQPKAYRIVDKPGPQKDSGNE